MISEFHFIRPWWLLASLFLFIAVILLRKIQLNHSSWQKLLPKHLAKVLIKQQGSNKPLSLIPVVFMGTLTILALAGPTWQKLPQPVYQVNTGSVLIMDMSYSMYATDISPNRLTRARFKAMDLLDNISDGEVGLIAYAGDAFSISPLTEDVNNIKLLLPSLSPELMPELGSNPYAALVLAHEMLKNAGHKEGNIYWFTDGIDSIDIQDITEWSREYPYRLNILGIGTTTGAPIKLPNGELMKDDNGAIVVPKLSQNYLSSAASRGRGHYSAISNNDNDIKQLLLTKKRPLNEKGKLSDNTGDQWQEFGPYLLILVLPVLLTYFRRGILLIGLPFVFLLLPNQHAYAADWQQLWQDLWHTKDQQGQQHFKQQQYQQAAEQFNDPLWQGSAHYKAGNFEQALNVFQQFDSAEALFNQGNALAKLNQFEKAIAAYDQALAKAPELTDAKANKQLLEQLLQEQEQEQENKQSDNQQQDQSNSQKNDQQAEKEQQSQQDQNSQQQDNNQSSKSGQQSDDNNQSPPNDQSSESSPENQSENAEQKASENKKNTESSKDVKVEKDGQTSSKQTQAAQLTEQQIKETEQKHQQLLNKVTDDPHLLLRNKMQLEYKKRRQNRSSVGVKKKW